MRIKITGLLFLFSTVLLSAQQENDRFFRVASRLVEAMNKQDYAAIVNEYDPGMTAAFPLLKTTILFKNYESQYGKVVKIDTPQVKAIDQAVCVMYFERGVQDLTLYINEQEKIKGFLFATHVAVEPARPFSPPPSEQKPLPAPVKASTPVTSPEPKTPMTSTSSSSGGETKKDAEPAASSSSAALKPAAPSVPVVADKQLTEIYLPFKGTWTVIVGGEIREGASQSNLLQQQYAYEFSAKDGEGFRYKNNGKTNEDFFGFGKEILAPASGTVVEVIDGIRDNSPGTRNPYAPIGNAIIIQHSSREYSVVSYLKQGSTRVNAGDKVARGQVIAQCGNSGASTEPSVHYHLQDSPFLPAAKGKKFYFERAMVTTDGKKELKQIHLPEVGEIIAPE